MTALGDVRICYKLGLCVLAAHHKPSQDCDCPLTLSFLLQGNKTRGHVSSSRGELCIPV